MWSVVGPGLADPGHIELTSRTVYLDSDTLLGSRQEIVTGTLEPNRILATFGVGIHEVLHAKHTKLWVSDRDTELSEAEDEALCQLAVDRQLLEEPRMEANGVREFPQGTRRGQFIRRAIGAAAVEVILPRLSEALMLEALSAGAVSRDLAGRSMVYLKARCHYGVCDPTKLGPLPGLWAQVLGSDDVARLDDLFARLIWAKDGDNDALDRYASEYRQIIGPPPPPPPSSGQGDGTPERARPARATRQGSGTGAEDGSSTEASGGAGAQQATPQSLGEALQQALREQREGELKQLNEDLDLQTLLKAATKTEPPSGRGRGTGMPTGRMPDRGVDRPPMSDEVQMARQYARRMHQAREVGLKRIDKRTPGGRFNARAHMRAHAQRAIGTPVTAHPWEITKVVTAPLQEPHVGLVIDTSGSMASYEYALGPIAWVLSTGLREFGGRLAIALFGNGAELLTDGSQPTAADPGDPHRRRHRVRRRRDLPVRRPPRVQQPPPAQIHLCDLRRRVVLTPRRAWRKSTSCANWACRSCISASASSPCRSRPTRWSRSRTRPPRWTSSPPTPSPRSAPAAAGAESTGQPGMRLGLESPNPKGASRVTASNPALLPDPPLFDVTDIAKKGVEGSIERFGLDELELAPNARREISADGLERLAGLLMRAGQLVPLIGYRREAAGPVTVYEGQRRYLAAQKSHELAGTERYEGLDPVHSLIVLLLDHEPNADEIRRIQAIANNARESLSVVDQQNQFADCWLARAGLGDEDRIAAVCADLGISAKKAHNLRRQLTLPDPIRARVAERPVADQLSATMANQLATMNAIAPELTEAVAKRITSPELHDKAVKDLGAFVHRTVVEDEHTYAVRIDDGAMLDGHEQIQQARAHMSTESTEPLAGILGCEPASSRRNSTHSPRARRTRR